MRVTKGCPICTGDVLGTAETGYYCKRCNLLFQKRHIVFKHAREEIHETIRKHFSIIEPVRPHERARPVTNEPLPQGKRLLDRLSERMANTLKEIRHAKEDLAEAVERLPAEVPAAKKIVKKTVKRAPKKPTKKRQGARKSTRTPVKKKVPPKKKATKKKPAKKKAVKRKATKPRPTKRGSGRK